MNLQSFPSKIKGVVKKADILFQGDQRNRLYDYDRMILFATIWFLKVQIYVNINTPSFLKHFTADLHKGSSFLKNSVSEGEILNLLHRVPKFLGESDNLEGIMFSSLLYKLLVQIRLLKAQVLLLELMKSDEVRLNLHLKKNIGTLREGLIFLSKSDICQKYGGMEEAEKQIIEKFKGLVKKVESLCKSNPDINTVEGMMSDDVRPLKTKLKGLYVYLIPSLSFPKTIGLGCIEAVLQKMEQLQGVELESHDSIACATYQIEAVHKDLESIVPWYRNKLVVTDEQIENLKKMDEISKEFVDAVYQVEHVIDSIVLGRDPLWKLLLWLYHLSEVIEQLRLQIRGCESCGNLEFAIPRTQMDYDPFTECFNTTEARYQNLPTDLKQCLLYFGAFPRDEDVSVRTLLWLWIAERFIPQSSSECLEDVAERFIPQSSSECLEDVAEQYLMNLISRSLVVAVKRGSNGKVKTCRVDAQVLELCLSEAEGAKYIHLVTGETYSGENYVDYRLSIHGDPRQFIRSKPSGSSVRSLLFFVSNEMYAGCHNDLAFIIDKMKLLKVLNLESLNIGNTLENGVGLLICLRYLAIGGDIDSLPSSLSKLKDLETLVVKGLKNHFVLPSTIWTMTRLRHIQVTDCIFTLELQNHPQKEGDFLKLDGLKSLSRPSFQYGRETDDILARLPNLHRLKCILLQPRLGEVEWFPEFGCVRHLESLKICYSGRPLNNVEWSLPLNLKELTLSNFRLPWEQISAVGLLPNLEVLKLISRAFDGATWDMEEGEFENLRYLKLDSLNIVHWNPAEDCLPNLEQLVLENCKQLEEFPSSFKFILGLQQIQVYNCGTLVEESAQRIVEDRQNGSDADTFVSHSMPSSLCMEETNDILTKHPDLCKLKCILLPPRLGVVWQFPELGSIRDFDSLKLLYPQKPLNNLALWNLPLSLKDLTLSNFHLPWDQISTISKLPNLEVLKLLSEAFVGTTWRMEEGEFEKLRYLKLVSLNLVHWYADEDFLPNLEQLVLRKCNQLEELPTGFGTIVTLERIQVHECGVFVENWAREIVQTQLDYSNLDIVGNFS